MISEFAEKPDLNGEHQFKSEQLTDLRFIHQTVKPFSINITFYRSTAFLNIRCSTTFKDRILLHDVIEQAKVQRMYIKNMKPTKIDLPTQK